MGNEFINEKKSFISQRFTGIIELRFSSTLPSSQRKLHILIFAETDSIHPGPCEKLLFLIRIVLLKGRWYGQVDPRALGANSLRRLAKYASQKKNRSRRHSLRPLSRKRRKIRCSCIQQHNDLTCAIRSSKDTNRGSP
jgi:hypothetical protein